MFLPLTVPIVLAALALAVPPPPAVHAPHPGKATPDPCAKIAGKQFSLPSDVRACFNSFPFNQTLATNVLSVHQKVFNFYTFEDYYLNSPPPFQESTVNIRAELARIGATKYASDYAFNHDLYNFVTKLNDGHTRWFPGCYTQIWQNILPAPIANFLDPATGVQSMFIAPDSVAFLSQLGANFTNYFASLNPPFNWQRLAGAKILSINGLAPFDFADLIASTVSGNYLDHGVRVNSVFTSFRIQGGLSQRLGDIAGPPLPDFDSLTMSLLLAGSKVPEVVVVPYAMDYLGPAFTDGADYWATNCLANAATNGIDFNAAAPTSQSPLVSPFSSPSIPTTPVSPSPAPFVATQPRARFARGDIIQTDAKQPASAIGLPAPFFPTVPLVAGGEGVINSYVLEGNKTGVIFIGSFSPSTALPGFGFPQFENDIVDSFAAFKTAGVQNVLIDLSNNGGGFVCLGQFLHQFLAGSQIGYPGFQSTQRGNTLAQKIVAANVALQLNDTFYSPLNWAFFNDTEFPITFNYDKPVVQQFINFVPDATSQRFHDICTPFNVTIPTTPPFPLDKIAIIGNANCASTCAMFSTLMVERHNTKTLIFGGKPGEPMEYKGMAGNQVLEWSDLDSEVKTAHLKSDPLAAPDLLINANLRHNWRTAWSFENEQVPIAYVSERANLRFPYTNETYNNPQKSWVFAASKLFP